MEFIAKRIVARSLVASIVPVSIYSTVYALAKFTGSAEFEFINMYAMAVLAVTSFVYPLNAIGLFMFFTPLDLLWENLIVKARNA